MIQPRFENRRGVAAVFGRAQDHDDVGGLRLIHPRLAANFARHGGQADPCCDGPHRGRAQSDSEQDPVHAICWAFRSIVGPLQDVVETLISDKNPLLKEVRRLAAGGAPGDDRLALAEGPHLLDEALRSGIEIHAVILAESAGEVPDLGSTRVVRVLDSLFNKLASTESPQGVLALVRLPQWTADDVLRGTPLVVVLDGVQDPGNAGAILRTAEAFAATGAVFLKGTVSPSNPKCLRASAGSAFRLPIIFEIPAGIAVFTESLALYAADRRGALAVSQAQLRVPCAIVIGAEGRGVRPELAARAIGLKIPIVNVESLNAAVAAGILLYEARRQRSL